MNLTINELERRLYIEGRNVERAALLEFEEAWDSAWDDTNEEYGMTAEAVADAGFSAMRTAL